MKFLLNFLDRTLQKFKLHLFIILPYFCKIYILVSNLIFQSGQKTE